MREKLIDFYSIDFKMLFIINNLIEHQMRSNNPKIQERHHYLSLIKFKTRSDQIPQ